MDKRGEGRLTALYVVLGVGLVLGIFIPALVNAFIDTSIPDTNSAVYGISSFFAEGVNFTIPLPLIADPTIDLDLFGFLPESLESYFDSTWYSFTFLPDYLSIPIMIFLAVSFLYVLITLIPTVGG